MSLGKRKQEILDSLYNHCSCRTNRSKDVLQKLLDDVKIYPGDTGKEKLLGIIREYKATGKNLESTINSIYDILYPVKTGATTNTNEYEF
jgi:hypothetical protein